MAGLEIIEARITYLAYAPEIAAAMLQHQQASAIVDARKLIAEGAVGMVKMALERLNEKHTLGLDEERKAAMVSRGYLNSFVRSLHGVISNESHFRIKLIRFCSSFPSFQICCIQNVPSGYKRHAVF